MFRRATFLLMVSVICVVSTSPVLAGACDIVVGEGSRISNELEFRYQANIGGINYTIEAEGFVLGTKRVEEDGTTHLVSTIDWQILDNGIELTSFSEILLQPTDRPGVFTATDHSKVVRGNKRYNCGELMIQQDPPGGSVLQLTGKLCKCD